jgi:hypothetical protein
MARRMGGTELEPVTSCLEGECPEWTPGTDAVL